MFLHVAWELMGLMLVLVKVLQVALQEAHHLLLQVHLLQAALLLHLLLAALFVSITLLPAVMGEPLPVQQPIQLKSVLLLE